MKKWLYTFLVLLSPKSSSGEDGADNDTLMNHKKCIEALKVADKDKDNKINGDEFVEIVKLMSPQDFLKDATEFEDLYLGMKTAFTLKAIGFGDAAHISIDGIENPTNERSKFFIEVCLATERSISDILSSSNVPSVAPMTSEPTTPNQTWEPTHFPVTLAPITDAPTKTPTLGPTAELPILITYEVGYRNGYQKNMSEAYENELEISMNILAREVIYSNISGARNLRRKLETFVSENEIANFVPVGILPSIDACPDEIIENLFSAECATIQHSLTLVTNDKDPTFIHNQFRNILNKTVIGRGLQKVLDNEYPNSTLFIVTGYFFKPESPIVEPQMAKVLNAGATGGIAASVIVVVAVVATLIYTYHRGEEKKDKEIFSPDAQQELTTAHMEDIMPSKEDNLVFNPSQQDYKKTGKTSLQATKTLAEEKHSDVILKKTGDAIDSSSNAGSSGWSSSAGFSSLNTGSIDSLDIVNKDGIPLSRLATIGVQSAIVTKRSSKDDHRDVPDVPNITREDLDSAIELGDWAAVGATAALLAAASDSQSYSSRSRKTDTSMSRGGSSVSSLDAARAAELDHLVDAGDWEGVVVAAAKFEASEDASTGSSKSSRETNTAGESSGLGSQSESLSENPCKATKRNEIRNEVESLVSRVVPEEIDNVDEMMLQFKGREEELVETLRTMQERQVAQKARVQGRKQAKRDARQTKRKGGTVLLDPSSSKPDEENQVSTSTASSVSNDSIVASIGVDIGATAGISSAVNIEGEADSSSNNLIFETSSSESGGENNFAQTAVNVPPILGDENSRAASMTGDSSFSSRKQTTALEMAIEAGDWEAVGEAAAMMSDGASTADTSEVNRIAEQGESSTLSGDSPYKVHAERASELDEMIDADNWSAVVAAASRFNATDNHTVSNIPQDIARYIDDSAATSVDSNEAQRRSDTIEDQEKEKQIKEEKEALAQAEIWMAIAEQSKTDGSKGKQVQPTKKF